LAASMLVAKAIKLRLPMCTSLNSMRGNAPKTLGLHNHQKMHFRRFY
jgi:hypothetical protein